MMPIRLSRGGSALVLLLALTLPPVPSQSQSAATVSLSAPVRLSGRWDFNQGQATDLWSVEIKNINDDGRIEGLITYWGRRCKARDTPLKDGSWRDGVLRLTAHGGVDCGDMHFELKPGAKRLLEGFVGADFDPSIRTVVWLDRR
jgi:hypothetical protein